MGTAVPGAMATADAIRAQIAAAEALLSQAKQGTQAGMLQREEAVERQRLRRRLDILNQQVAGERETAAIYTNGAREVDHDRQGPYLPNLPPSRHVLSSPTENKDRHGRARTRPGEYHVSFSQDAIRTEYVWKIEGMSWLHLALEREDKEYAVTDVYKIQETGDKFEFLYNASDGPVLAGDDDEQFFTSLGFRFKEETESAIRYKICIQRSGCDFVPWGPQREVSSQVMKEQNVFGPDVHSRSGCATGIFGLSHKQLLQSEWVHNDVLTVKFELEVLGAREDTLTVTLPLKRMQVRVPPPSLASNFTSFLEDGNLSDVTFVVKGESVRAHSQVLAARCEVFGRQMQSGMRESESKRVTIDECEPDAFQAFLLFLYSDDFSEVTKYMEPRVTKNSDQGSSDARTASSFLQDVMSISHKYQIPRLTLWCEQQLCDSISEENVCSVLSQAHLCEAKHLEDTCLSYIKNNMEKIASTPGFAQLSVAWPQIMLRLSLFVSGASSESVAASVAAQESALRKRKRE